MPHSHSSRIGRLFLRSLLALAPLVVPTWVAAEPYDRADLQRIERAVQSVAERTTPSVVAITHETRGGMASGTGTIVAKDGLILSAAHVLAGAETVDVMFPDGTMRTAKVLGSDASRDVALARIKEPGDYPFVEMGQSGKLKVGDLVVALGHPGGYDMRRKPPVRFGRLFAVNEEGYLRSDCTLIGGDSGGPLLDLEGKLVGVHSSVGFDMSMNNDAPVDAARAGWDRMLKGERWGSPPIGGENEPPKLTPAELAGLDVRRFRRRVRAAAIANKGQLSADPETIARWLKESGMDEARVKAIGPGGMVEFLGKVMGRDARVEGREEKPATQPTTGPSAEELAGLDLEKFRKRVVARAMESGGKLEAKPKEIAEWLRADGMRAERVEAMKDAELAAFLQRALGGVATAKANVASTQPAKVDESVAAAQKQGLDVDKLKARVAADGARSGGRLNVTPGVVADWLSAAGMARDAVEKMSPLDLIRLCTKALGGTATTADELAASAGAKAIVEQDRAILATIKPDLAKVAPSVVTLIDGDRDDARALALGTIVRPDGFLLTKRSEVAKAKSGLRARLADGRSIPAKVVKEYADHDLALVKIAAKELTAVTFPAAAADAALKPGSFVFAAGTTSDDPLLALGAVSVEGRSLRDAGGYLGVGLADGEGAVRIRSLEPDGPAARAGILKDDRVTALNGEAVTKPAELSLRIRALKPGATARVTYRRGDDKTDHTAEIALGDRAKLPVRQPLPPGRGGGRRAQMATAIGTDTSDVRTGFPLILQHDQPIKPQDCGGPILDLAGGVVGLNIARAGRVDTYALPAKLLAELLAAVDFATLAADGDTAPASK